MTKSIIIIIWCTLIPMSSLLCPNFAHADTLPQKHFPPSVIAIEIRGVEESGVYRTAVKPTIQVPEREADISALLNNQPYDFAEIATDGNYLLEIVAVDSNGNSSRKSISFLIDTTPPVTSVSGATQKFRSAKTIYLGKSDAIELSSADSGSGISGVSKTQYRLGNSTDWQDYKNPIELNVLAEGKHTLYYRSLDNAGNIEAVKTLEFFIDVNAPSSTIEIGDPHFKNNSDGIFFISNATVFSISATDDESGVEQIEYRIDGGVWSLYREPFNIDTEGEHTIAFRATDRAGTIGQVKQITILNDSNPPISNLTLNDQRIDTAEIYYINRPVKLSISASDMHSGIKKSEYRIDQGNWQTTSPFIVDDSKNHLISFKSTDNLNNQEIIKTVSVHIDKTPPVTKISMNPKPQDEVKDLQIVNDITFFTLDATDTGSGAAFTEYRIDRGEWLPYEPFTIHQSGQHLIEFKSTDSAGNQESPKALSVLVDTSPPSSTITVNKKTIAPGESLYSKAAVTVALSANDNVSRIKLIEYRLNDGPWSPYQPFSLSTEGSHSIEFRSTDNLGNTESTKFIKVVIDNTPPVTSLVYGIPSQTELDMVQISTGTVISLNAIEELSGPVSSEYRITGKGERQGSEPFSIATPGEYEIRFWSIDKAGNRESEKLSKVKVSPPQPRPVIANSDEKSFPGDKQDSRSRGTDAEIPESIRIPVEQTKPSIPVVSKDKKTLPVKSDTIDDEAVYISEYMPNQGDLSYAFGTSAPRTNTKELLAVGGINALIIAIIFLLL